MMVPKILGSFVLLQFVAVIQCLSSPKHRFNRREYIQRTLAISPFIVPSISNAITSADEQGVSAITTSQLGTAFRKSVVQGAQVADKLDEKWERFSDSLRDKGRCDPATGRRLYDNGKRKDGTPIGNPGLGELCSPDPILPINLDTTKIVIDSAVKSALNVSGGGASKADALNKKIQETKELVRPSFERSMQNTKSEDEMNRGEYKFELYCTLRAITNYLRENKSSIREFQYAWGSQIVSIYASSATKKDFVSPFPTGEEDLDDYDYDKENLLDALGKLTVTLNAFKDAGLLGFYEISIPYDDYGSVVTVAMDDYTSIQTEILLSEQNYDCDGPIQAITRSLFKQAKIKPDSLNTFFMDTYYKDPVNYNPTQLLISLNGLSKM